MKKELILASLVLFYVGGFSQQIHIPIFLGETEDRVTNYLDSINQLKKIPFSPQTRKTTESGDLVIQNLLPLEYQSFYGCWSILVSFIRISGVEVCIKQVVMGSPEYEQYQLRYVKDNFTFVKEGTWERSSYLGTLKALIRYHQLKCGENNDSYMYAMEYELSP